MNIEELIDEELKSAAKIHGEKFYSRHQGYAVLKEEIEELEQDVKGLNSELERLWYYIKRDVDDVKNELESLEVVSENAIKEAIQVGAMVRKLINFYDNRKRGN